MSKLKIKPLNADIAKVLKRIQDSIPSEWLNALGTEQLIAPTIKFAYEKAVKDKTIHTQLFKIRIDEMKANNEEVTPAIEKQVMKESKERAKDIKRKAQIMLDSGELDKKMLVIDKKIEKKIDKYIEDEITAAIRRGELPKGKKYRNLDKQIKKAVKKTK